MDKKEMTILFFTAYFIIVFLLTRLLCTLDCKIRDGVIIRDINEIGGIVETEKPE